MFLYLLSLGKPLISRTLAKKLTVVIAVAVVVLMFSTPFYGAFGAQNSGISSQSNKNHVYLVTTTIGNKNYSYYEDVHDGKVTKTWPAASAPSGLASNITSQEAQSSGSLSLPTGNFSTPSNLQVKSGSTAQVSAYSQNQSSKSDPGNTGGSFDLTQTYSVNSVTLSPSSSNMYIGQTLNLKGSWTGGQSPYNFVWRVAQSQPLNWIESYYTNASQLTTNTFAFTPPHPGNFIIFLFVSGSGTGVGINASAVISVQGQPFQNGQPNQATQNYLQNMTLTPTTTVMSTGLEINFAGNWTGTSPTYGYAWMVVPSQAINAPGPGPGPGPVPGNWQSYYQGAINKINTYNFTSQPSTSFTFNPVYGSYGIFYLYLFVITNNAQGPGGGPGPDQDNQQNSLVSFAKIILLPGTPGVSSVTMSPTSVNYITNSGQHGESNSVPIVFTASWTGGTPAYSYVWMVTAGQPISAPYIIQFSSYNTTSGDSATYSYTPPDNGRYYVYLFVGSSSSSAYVMAVSQIDAHGDRQPTVSQATISQTTVDANIGQSIGFSANWIGGISPYTYVWYVSSNFPHWQQGFQPFNKENTTSQPNAQFTFIPSSYGVYYAYLFINNYVNNPPPVDDEDHDDGLALVATAEVIVLHTSLPLTSSAISLSPTTTLVDNPITATVAPGYGTGPFTYSWVVTSPGGATTSTSSYSTSADQITFSSPGTYSVTVTITDAAGVSASQTATVTIMSQLSVSISASGLTSIDKGQSSTLVVTSLSGGFPSYMGQWIVEQPGFQSYINLGSSFPINPNDLLTASVSTGVLSITGTWLFELEITDSSSEVTYSNSVAITVNQPLSVILYSSSGQTDVGGSLTFTNTTQGGTMPFSYSYSVTPNSGFTESTNPGNTFTFNSQGSYSVKLIVTDVTGSTATSTIVIDVNPAPTINGQPQSYSIDPAQQFGPLISTVEGGSGTYSWQWFYVSSGGASLITGANGIGPTATFDPTQAGSYYAVFKDSIGITVSSNVAQVTVNLQPTVSISPQAITVYSSQSDQLTATTGGGSGSFGYSWTIGGRANNMGTSSQFTFSEKKEGIYTVWLNVTDIGTTPNYVLSPISITITVVKAPTVQITPPSATIDTSQSLVLSAVLSIRTGDFSYSWTIGGSSTVVGTSSTYTFSESTSNVYTVWLNITIGNTHPAEIVTATSVITVVASPSISEQPQSATIDSGQSIVITSTVAGGTGSFTWQWYDSSGLISGDSGTTATASAIFSSALQGIYVTFTDTGTSASPEPTITSNTVSVSIKPALSITSEPTAGTIDRGESTTLTAAVSGGTGLYSWTLFTSSDVNVTYGTSSTVTYTFSPSVSASYYFKFKDVGVTPGATPPAIKTTNTVLITVNNALVPLINPSSASLTVGASQTFSSATQGGSGDYSYSWTIGGNSQPVGTASTYVYTAQAQGTQKLWLNVTDLGTTSHYTLSVTATIQVSSGSLSVTFTANNPVSGTGAIDLGQSVSLSYTPTIAGGKSPYSYQWFLNGTSISYKVGLSGTAVSGTAITYSFDPTGTGTYVFYLQISSSDNQASISSGLSIKVYSTPAISSQPSSSTIDTGQTVALTATVSGGTGTFLWSLLTSGGTLVTSSTGAAASYSFKPNSNSSYYFTFTDNGVMPTATSVSLVSTNTVTVTVYPDPTVTVLPVTISSGLTATLTATASGGSKIGYSFKWYSNQGLTTLLYSGNPFSTPALTVSTTYYVTVSDSTGFVSAPASAIVTVVGSLTSSSLTISPTSTDVGIASSVTVSTGAGVAPYSYTWTVTLYPSGSASGDYTTSRNKVTFTQAGVYSVSVTVRDSSGQSASISKVITVDPVPSITLSPTSATIDVGASITFSNSSSGGTSPFTYGWGYPTGAGVTQNGNQFTFSNTGTFTIKLYLNDTVGASGVSTASITVNNQPVIVYSSLTVVISGASTMDTGTATNIAITSISGTGPYTAQLEAEGPTSTSYSVVASTNQFSTLPEYVSTGTLTTLGQWHFVVVATEVSNTGIFGTSSPVTVNVVNAPVTSALSLSPTTTDIGIPVSLSIQQGYGTAPFVYSWAVALSGGGSATGDFTFSGNQITFNTQGSYSVTATVQDADSLTASITATITVNAPLSVTISAVTPTTIDKGQTVTFSNSESGGIGPYTISYSVSPVGGGIKFGSYSISGNVISFLIPGQYNVGSTVTDSLSDTVSSTNSITVTVNALPTVTLTPSLNPIDVGNSVTFSNTTAYGTAPYTYIWSYPASEGIKQQVNTFTFTAQGNFTITLSIVDAVGVVASSSVLIRVNPSPIIVLHPESMNVTGNSSILSSASQKFQPQLTWQKKTFSGGGGTTITLDESTSWSVYVQAGTGTPPFSFSWAIVYSSNSTTATDYTLGSTNSSYVDNVITFTGTGTYSVTITVTDKYDATSSESLTIDVNNPLLVVTATIQATATSLDVGTSTTLTSTPTISGGTSPYSFQWYRNGTVSSDQISGQSGPITTNTPISLPQTPTVPGNYTYYLVISDSAYSPASNSTKIVIQVNRIPTTASLEISPTSTVIDGLITASVISGNGTAPFNYTWTVTPVGSTSSTTHYGDQLALSQSGNYSVSLKLTDGDGKIAYNNTTIRIYSSNLVIVKISSPTSPPTIDVGQSETITGGFSSGSGSYEYEWVVQSTASSSPPASGYVTGLSPQSYTFTPSSSGTYYVYLYVKDTIVGDIQGGYIEVKVNNDLSQSSISVSPTATSIGSPVTATVTSGYGTPPFTYTWTVTLANGGSAAGDYTPSGNQVTFSSAGNYTVTVKASDSYSSATSSSFNIDVSAVVSLTASISTYPNAGITAIDVRHAQEFQANVAGGTGTYSYSWGLSGVSGAVSTSSSYTFNVTSPGLYIVYLNVSEGTSRTSASPITVIVNPLPNASFGGSSIMESDVGQSISVVVVGGTPPYVYSWTVSLYPSGTLAVNDYVASGTSVYFTQTGNYSVKFSATDADGVTSTVTATFIVNNQISSSLSLVNPLSSVIDRGNSTVLNVTISGGSGLFSYQWFEQLSGSSSFQIVPGAINSTYDFITSNFTVPGIYLFYVNVTDLKTDPAYVHSNIISVKVLSTIIYPVSFSEAGLPSGMKWFVNITNGQSFSSSSNKISFLESNGTYSFTVSTGNKTYRLSSHSSSVFSFSVSGSGVRQSLVFLPVVYSVTFSEYGLTNGMKWFVNLSNGQSLSSTLNVISFSETNGTYQYVIDTSNKHYKPQTSSSFFDISGSSISRSVYFELVTFNVTFDESNLPSGIKWFVNLSNGQSFNATKGSINFIDPNGTYYFSIATTDKIFYSIGGSFTVSGQSKFVYITFLPYLNNISFVESGLPTGIKWNVSLVGPGSSVNHSSTGAIYFNEVNGTYNFSIGSIPGYKTDNYLITIVVNGGPFRSIIVWTAVTYPVTIVETGLAPGETWSVTLTTVQNGEEKVMTLNSTSSSITFNATNGSYSYSVSLPQGYRGSPIKSTISVVGGAVTTKLTITALPNYLLIWLVIGGAAIIIAVIALYIMASRKSLFKREGRFLKLDRGKVKK